MGQSNNELMDMIKQVNNIVETRRSNQVWEHCRKLNVTYPL